MPIQRCILISLCLVVLNACGGGAGPADGGSRDSAIDAHVEVDAGPCGLVCPDDRPICDAASGACVECSNDTQCGDDRPVCDAAASVCVECRDDTQCGDDRPVCDAAASVCVECLADTQCGETTRCDSEILRCVHCIGDADCDEGVSCVGGACDRACGRAVAPSTGALCAIGACVGTETLLDGPHFRNGAPSIAVSDSGVQVLYATAEGELVGDLVVPGATPERLPFPVAVGSVVETEHTWSWTDNGAFGLRLHRNDGGGWDEVAEREGHAADHALAVDDASCAHVVHRTADNQLYYARWAGAGWVERRLESATASQPRIALTSDGTPAFAWVRRGESGLEVVFQRGGGAVEPVQEFSRSPSIWMALASDRPHFLIEGGGRTGPELFTYVRPMEFGRVRTRFGENSVESCPGGSSDGETCQTTSVRLHALDTVSDGVEDVRILIGEVTERADLTARCDESGPGGPPPGCTWEGTRTYTGRLLMARPGTGGSIDLQPVPGVTVPMQRGAAVVGPDGAIHLAAYGPPTSEADDGGGQFAVYYIAIATE